MEDVDCCTKRDHRASDAGLLQIGYALRNVARIADGDTRVDHQDLFSSIARHLEIDLNFSNVKCVLETRVSFKIIYLGEPP